MQFAAGSQGHDLGRCCAPALSDLLASNLAMSNMLCCIKRLGGSSNAVTGLQFLLLLDPKLVMYRA